MTDRVEFLRNPNEPLHVAFRRGETFCGLPRDSFTWITPTPFTKWQRVLCSECSQKLTL